MIFPFFLELGTYLHVMFKSVSVKLSETLRKLCVSAKFPHQRIRWNYDILHSVCISTYKYCEKEESKNKINNATCNIKLWCDRTFCDVFSTRNTSHSSLYPLKTSANQSFPRRNWNFDGCLVSHLIMITVVVLMMINSFWVCLVKNIIFNENVNSPPAHHKTTL